MGEGGFQLRLSSVLPSRLSSPPRPFGVHALLSRHTGTQHTHHRRPRGLRCLEVNRIIWSCSVLTPRPLKFHNRRGFFPHSAFYSICQSLRPVAVPPAKRLDTYTFSSPGWPPETRNRLKDRENWQKSHRSVSKDDVTPLHRWAWN